MAKPGPGSWKKKLAEEADARREEEERLEVERNERAKEEELERAAIPPLVEWIPQVSPELKSPTHLAEWCAFLDKAGTREAVRSLCDVPIRHHKTGTAKHAIARWLRRDPKLRILYITHTQLYANTRGREIRDLCKRAGVKLRKGHSTLHEWRTAEGGGVFVMSATSSALGQDVDILLVDDPFRKPADADNPDTRQKVDDLITFYTARLPEWGSAFLIMSRFHPDDPIGRRLMRTEEVWKHLHSRAIIDEGKPTERAFAPHIRSLAYLKSIRATLKESDPRERVWWSQFQNEPISLDGELFKLFARYVILPTEPGWRDVLGIDIAYSTSKKADWFASVLLRIWGSTAYIRRVRRLKADLSLLVLDVEAAWKFNGSRCPVFSYISGPEKGSIKYFAEHNIPIGGMAARFSKRVRSQKTIDFATDKRILAPEKGAVGADDADIEQFLQRLYAWRGLDTDEDDEVDGLVSAVDGGMWSSVTSPTTTLGTRRI